MRVAATPDAAIAGRVTSLDLGLLYDLVGWCQRWRWEERGVLVCVRACVCWGKGRERTGGQAEWPGERGQASSIVLESSVTASPVGSAGYFAMLPVVAFHKGAFKSGLGGSMTMTLGFAHRVGWYVCFCWPGRASHACATAEHMPWLLSIARHPGRLWTSRARR
jgi:hypothetical protein